MLVVNTLPTKVEDPDDNIDHELSDDFKDNSKDRLIIHYNIVSVLSNEYGFTWEASRDEEEAMCKESTGHKPVFYYVMNSWMVE